MPYPLASKSPARRSSASGTHGGARTWPDLEPPVPRERMPRHAAIIMDGNGRWATGRGMLRVRGHEAGVEAVRDVVRYCGQVKLQVLTLYAFSTENWKRPRGEVSFLMRLLKRYLVREREELRANGVRLTSIGRIAELPDDVRGTLLETQAALAANTGLTLCLALNYGAHDEMLDAARTLARRVARGELAPEDITVDALRGALQTTALPPLDLMIRTAGEQRVSNFLLWRLDDAVFHVAEVCWPDFRAPQMRAACEDYAACAGVRDG